MTLNTATFKRPLFLAPAIIGLLLLAIHYWSDLETTVLNPELQRTLGGSYIELSHGATHYELSGKAHSPTMVLVHGFSIPSYLWDKNIAALKNAGFRVLRFDLYGRGYSARPSLDYTLDLFVHQLEEITQKLGIEGPFHLAGISMGGAIATRFAIKHPNKLASLSLLAPLVATPERFDLKLLKLPLLGEYLATVVMMPKIASNLKQAVYDPTSYPEWQANMQQHIHLKGYRQALLSTARNLAGKSEISNYIALGKTQVPVQVIWGRQDAIANYAQASALQEAMPNMKLRTLDKSGHLPQIEHPKQVNAWLIDHAKHGDGEIKK